MKTSLCLLVAALIGFACGYTVGVGTAERNQSFNLELHSGPHGIGVSGRLPASFTLPPAAQPARPAPVAAAEPCGVPGVDADGNETYGAPCGLSGGAR